MLELRGQACRGTCTHALTCCEKRMYHMMQRLVHISAAVRSLQRVPEAPKIQARLDLTSSVAVRPVTIWP